MLCGTCFVKIPEESFSNGLERCLELVYHMFFFFLGIAPEIINSSIRLCIKARVSCCCNHVIKINLLQTQVVETKASVLPIRNSFYYGASSLVCIVTFSLDLSSGIA